MSQTLIINMRKIGLVGPEQPLMRSATRVQAWDRDAFSGSNTEATAASA